MEPRANTAMLPPVMVCAEKRVQRVTANGFCSPRSWIQIHFAGWNSLKVPYSQAVRVVSFCACEVVTTINTCLSGHIRTWDRPRDATNPSEVTLSST